MEIPAGLVTNITIQAELLARSYFVLISLISLISTFRIEKKFNILDNHRNLFANVKHIIWIEFQCSK